MAKQEQHDLREYILSTEPINVGTGVLANMAIPVSGQVVRVLACMNTAISTADADITFQLSNVNLVSGGVTATLTLPTAASAAGDVEVIEFDPLNKINLALEAVDGQPLTTGGTLEIIAAGGATGAVIFVVVIKRD